MFTKHNVIPYVHAHSSLKSNTNEQKITYPPSTARMNAEAPTYMYIFFNVPTLRSPQQIIHSKRFLVANGCAFHIHKITHSKFK